MIAKQIIILKPKFTLLFILTFFWFTSCAQKVMKTYYDYYNLKLKEIWQIDKNGFKNGYYKSFYQNKMPNEIGQYINDIQTGIWKQFDEDGKLKFSANYKDGQYDGLSQVWDNGPGYHNLLKDRYHDSYGIYREVSYYKGGVVQSDIKRDGECKIFYNKDKPAKIWKNQNAQPIASSIRIWTIEGELFPLQKTINGVNYTANSDLQYNNGYFITSPTKYLGDSSGWKITITGPEWSQYPRTAAIDKDSDFWWDGIPIEMSTSLGYRYAEYKVVKEMDDKCIEMTYLTPPYDYTTSFLYDLQFLNYSYLIKTIEFSGSGDNSGVPKTNTKITFFDAEGKILKTARGISNGHKRDWQGHLNFKAE